MGELDLMIIFVGAMWGLGALGVGYLIYRSVKGTGGSNWQGVYIMKKISRKKMIQALVDKEFGFVIQYDGRIKNRMKCKYRNMKKKLFKTYYKDNIVECLLGDGIWVDTKDGYKIMTVDQDSKPDFSWIYDDEDYVQLELFDDEPKERQTKD